MFRGISNSWELVKASAAVLRADKELVVFPIVSTIGVLIVTASFALPMFFGGMFDPDKLDESKPLLIVTAFLFYLAQYFVIFFANSALVGAAMIRLRGGDPTVGDGFRIAAAHAWPILGYAFIAATVGMILRWLSERAGILGRIVIALVGMAWNIATYLVVPILVVEDIGPVDAIKRSMALLKRTWGEQLVGEFSIGLVFGIVAIVLMLMGVPAVIWAVSTGIVSLIVLVVATFAVALMVVVLISSTLSGIYTAAVYNYAATGEPDAYFRRELIQNAFRRK